MATVTLSATTRTDTGTANCGRMRAAGRVPAVLYGKGSTPVNLSIDHHELRVTFHEGKRRRESFTLEVDGTPHTVKIQEIQRDPVKGSARHIDFLLV